MTTTTQCTGCAVQQGTHQPAEALHKIAEPDAQHLQELAAYRFTVDNLQARVAELEERLEIDYRHPYDGIAARDATIKAQDERIAELESQLEAIGAGGVEPLRKPAAAPQAVQQGVQPSPEATSIAPTLMTNDQAIAWAWADVRKDVGTENWTTGDSCNFYGFFLHGWNYRGQYELQRNATKAAVMREIADTCDYELQQAPAHPAEGVPAQAAQPSDALIETVDAWFAENTGLGGCSDKDVAELAAIFATHPTQQGLDAQQFLNVADLEALERFAETASDDESYDIGKAAVARLAGFGCLQSHGFGRYSVTSFGSFILNDWDGARKLPFSTQAERDALAAAQAKQGGV